MSSSASSSIPYAPVSLSMVSLHPQARLPTRGSPEAAGLDLYTPFAVEIGPGERKLVPTGLALQLPIGTWAHVLPRSGLAVKKGIHVGAGVIDSDYRGELQVLLFNLSSETVSFEAGDRVAQLVVQSYVMATPFWIDPVTFASSSMTQRGAGGFGSSGA